MGQEVQQQAAGAADVGIADDMQHPQGRLPLAHRVPPAVPGTGARPSVFSAPFSKGLAAASGASPDSRADATVMAIRNQNRNTSLKLNQQSSVRPMNR